MSQPCLVRPDQTYHLVSEDQTMSLLPASQQELQTLQLIISQSVTAAAQVTWLDNNILHAFLETFWIAVGSLLPLVVFRQSFAVVSLDDRFILPRGVFVVQISPLNKEFSGAGVSLLPSLAEDSVDVRVRCPKLAVSL